MIMSYESSFFFIVGVFLVVGFLFFRVSMSWFIVLLEFIVVIVVMMEILNFL